MVIRLSSSSAGESFTVITSTGGTKTATLTRTFPAGTYLIESKAMDTNLEIYLGASDGTQVGTAAAGAKSITASAAFLYVTTVNADVNDAITFTLKSAATLATKTDAVWSPPTITDITPSGLPNVNDTTTITGTNFATNVDVKFRKSDDSTLVNAKSTVRGSATSIIATRPDTFAVGDAPYDVIVTNPSTNLTATSLNAITAGAVPVWVTSTTLNEAIIDTAFSQTISATDSDGGSSVTYAIVSGSFPTGLSLNTSTGAITGTPSGSTGTYTITISATDSGGNAVNRTFTQGLNPNAVTVDYLVVAGGGSGGSAWEGGGGGAGGLRSTVTATGGGGSLESSLSFTPGNTYTITIGGGGPQPSSAEGTMGNSGTNSSISGNGITTITSTGGGGGATAGSNGLSGGSGGGCSRGGSGNIPGSGTNNQGYSGGTNLSSDPNYASGGGGGAGGVGTNGSADSSPGNGGPGVYVSITGSSVAYAGGGGGSSSGGAGTGGVGGGGNGSGSSTGGAGQTNTGGGGGGVRNRYNAGGAGGSGVVILRSLGQASSTTGSPTYTNSGSYHIYKFTGDGSITY